MQLKNAKDLRLELVKAEKTAVWLASKLGYSTTYMYECIRKQNQNEIKRMKKILSEVE